MNANRETFVTFFGNLYRSCLVLAAFTAVAAPASANPATELTLVHGEASPGPDYDWVKFGGGQFLAWSNDDATRSFSSDGRTWQHYLTGQGDVAVTDAIYGNGVWMALWGEQWMRLGDDFQWMQPGNFIVQDTAFGNGLWLALGENGGVWQSPDARNWTLVADAEALIEEARAHYPGHPDLGPSVGIGMGLSFAGDSFVIGGLQHSPDGVEWTFTDEFPAAPPALGPWSQNFATEYYGSVRGPYVTESAISANGWILKDFRSTNFPYSHVSERDFAFSDDLAALMHTISVGGHFGGSSSGYLYVSDGAQLYEARASFGALRAVASSDTQAIAINGIGDMLIFDNGKWREHRLRSPAGVRDIAYGNDVWVTVGESGFVAVSDSDAESWNVQGALRKVGYHDGLFLALGDDLALVSQDGLEWRSATPPPPLETIGEMRIEDGFVIYNATGEQCAYSSDGMGWTLLDTSLHPVQAPVPGVPVSITASADSITLETEQGDVELFRDLQEFYDLAIGNKAVAFTGRWPYPAAGFLAFGNDGKYEIKNNAAILYRETFSRDGGLFAAAYGGGRFMLVGDGAVTFWTESFADYGTTDFLGAEEVWPAGEERPDLFDVAYGNDRFVAVGAGGAIYVSEPVASVHPTGGEVWNAGNDWYQHKDYGWFYTLPANKWEWHLTFGWVLRMDPNTDFYIPIDGLGWAWSDIDLLPWIYLFDEQQWWTVDMKSQIPNLVFWYYDEAAGQWTWRTQ